MFGTREGILKYKNKYKLYCIVSDNKSENIKQLHGSVQDASEIMILVIKRHHPTLYKKAYLVW